MAPRASSDKAVSFRAGTGAMHGFALCLLLFWLLNCVPLLLRTDSFFAYAYAKGATAKAVGVSEEKLEEASDALRSYLLNGTPLSVSTEGKSGQEPFFNSREIAHLADVRNLLVLCDKGWRIALFAGTLMLAAALCLLRTKALLCFSRAYLHTCAAASALCAVFALGLATNFMGCFTAMHHLLFPAGNWVFNPVKDRLIRMFPEAFFVSTAWLLLALFLLPVLLLGVVAIFVLQKRKRQKSSVCTSLKR